MGDHAFAPESRSGVTHAQPYSFRISNTASAAAVAAAEGARGAELSDLQERGAWGAAADPVFGRDAMMRRDEDEMDSPFAYA